MDSSVDYRPMPSGSAIPVSARRTARGARAAAGRRSFRHDTPPSPGVCWCGAKTQMGSGDGSLQPAGERVACQRPLCLPGASRHRAHRPDTDPCFLDHGRVGRAVILARGNPDPDRTGEDGQGHALGTHDALESRTRVRGCRAKAEAGDHLPAVVDGRDARPFEQAEVGCH